MVYRITVDGKRKYAEAPICEYSLEADNMAREEIIRHYLDGEGAKEVLFDTSLDEARELHEIAKEFFDRLLEFKAVWNDLPKDKSWGIDEMYLLIPQLMKIYILAMKLPETEYMEDTDYEISDLFRGRRVNFSDEFDFYWTIYNPYCNGDLYEEPLGSDDGICKSSLNDDIADIITDIAEGIGAYEKGLVCEAIFQWRSGLISHYGQHIWSALPAMCSLWETKMRIKEKDVTKYWVNE